MEYYGMQSKLKTMTAPDQLKVLLEEINEAYLWRINLGNAREIDVDEKDGRKRTINELHTTIELLLISSNYLNKW